MCACIFVLSPYTRCAYTHIHMNDHLLVLSFKVQSNIYCVNKLNNILVNLEKPIISPLTTFITKETYRQFSVHVISMLFSHTNMCKRL